MATYTSPSRCLVKLVSSVELSRPARVARTTNYLENGSTLEKANSWPPMGPPGRRGCIDRRGDEVTLDKVERISI